MPRNTTTQQFQEPESETPAQAPAPTVARNRPVRSARNAVDAAAEKIGQDKPRVMKSTGPARDALEAPQIEPVEGPVSKEKLDELAFMEEIVTVQVHDSTNENDEQLIQVTNDGVSQFFVRGVEMQVKRKYVYLLARAKRTTYKQQLVQLGEGDQTYKNVPHTALRYPFSVMHDPNPRGRAWLQKVLAEA